MKVPEFVHGNIAPVFTVFKNNLKIDEQGQQNMLDFLYDTKSISAYFVRSGLGQMFTYNFDDVKQMAKIACDHFKNRAPVIVGCNGIWDHDLTSLPDPDIFIKQAIQLSQYAELVGASGVVHTIPDMIRPKEVETIADVISHYFMTLNKEISIPIFIYQPPIIDPDYCVTPEIFAELAAMEKVVAAKVSTNDAEYILSLIEAAKDKEFAYIAGSETSFYAALYAGAQSVVGQGSSVNPQILKVVQECFESGDHKGALKAQVSVNYLCQVCRNPVDFLKRYACEQGYTMDRAYRKTGESIYIKYPEPLTENEYVKFKKIFENELAQYV
jgi:dihydrodipicolinate synthase/N-acetylneuraminate lyase